MADPWFKFYAADYLLDEQVDLLPLEAQGILIRLWCLCWRSGTIPDAPDTLALRAKVDARSMRKHWPTLRTFFIQADGGLVSERMEKERSGSKAMTEARRLGAQKTNEKRYGKRPQSEDEATRSKVAERVAERSVSESESESERTTPLPPQGGPAKAGRRGKGIRNLGDYPAEMLEAVKEYRGLMQECREPEILNCFPVEKQFIAASLGAREAIWKAWQGRLSGTRVHGVPVSSADLQAAVSMVVQLKRARATATENPQLAIPMLPSLINSDLFSDALVRVKELAHAS